MRERAGRSSTRRPCHQAVSVGLSRIEKNLSGIAATDKNTFADFAFFLTACECDLHLIKGRMIRYSLPIPMVALK